MNLDDIDVIDDDLSDSQSDSEVPETVHGSSFHTIIGVFKEIMTPALSVTLNFTTTLALFPAIAVMIRSEKKCRARGRFYNDLFIPFLFLLFNLFDLIGRFHAGGVKRLITPFNVHIPTIGRLVFFPLFLLCRVHGSILPQVFGHDYYPILFMIAFAYSNGYLASCSMMFGAAITDSSHASLAGTIMIFCLTLGLLIGSSLSFLVLKISQG
jgi:equilibrative nucleoside transporter 1/2/3